MYIIRQIMTCPQLYNKVDRWLQGDGLPSPSNDKAQHYKQVHYKQNHTHLTTACIYYTYTYIYNIHT